jgi:hypothetical protein
MDPIDLPIVPYSALSYIHSNSNHTIKTQTTNKTVDLGLAGAIVVCAIVQRSCKGFQAEEMPSGLLTFNKLPYKMAIQVSKILDTSLGQSSQFISFVPLSQLSKEEMRDICEKTGFRDWHEK